MGSIEELITAVRAALSTVAEGRTLTTQGRSALIEGTAALTGISRGSTNYQLRTALEALTAAIQAAERAESIEATVFEAIDAYVTEISEGSRPAAESPRDPEPTTRRRSSTPRGPDGKIDFRALAARAGITDVDIANRTMERVPDFDPAKQNPACWQGLAPRQKGDTATGNLFFPDGRKQNDVPLESGRGEPAFAPGQIRSEYQDLTPAKGHLEGNVAAWMMENQHKRMVLYLNEHPCDADGKGCYDNVGHFLPKGYQLLVWSRSANRTWRRRVFDGTGKAFTTRP